MLFFNRLTAVVLTAVLLAPAAPLEAKTRKGDKFLRDGRLLEAKKDWDAALENYEKALSEDPADVTYQMATTKARFQAAQAHVDNGLRIRLEGRLADSVVEFQKAWAINPASTAAEQEIRRTQEMIERERRKKAETGKEAPPAEQALTPVQAYKKESLDKLGTILPIPELRPLNPQPINLKMNNQPPRVLFETVCKLAGINLLFDPEYTPGKNQSIEFTNSTLDEALDYIGVVTKSYWKAMSPNTIFVTNDNVTKRRDYEEQVMKVFYLSNVTSPQELQEVVTAVRSVADIQRLFVYNSQNAIIARGEADRVALAEKIIADLDKPKSEVVVDILVMEASSVWSRKLTAAISPTGLNFPVSFTPRAGTRTVSDSASSSSSSSTTTGTTTTTTSTSTSQIPLANLGRLSTRDFSVTLPDALLQAVLSDAQTKVLQSPQLRSVDNQKATLKIGDRQPTATGSFQPGIGGVGINPLVNTQFTYIDVGVNVDLTPRVHDNGEVSLHVEVEISSVNGKVNLGGIDQPIIGQRKVIHDIRMREGEVNLLGGLINQQETRSVTGIPGLSSIPVLRRLFTGESMDRNRGELMIALVPHIVRRPEITAANLRGIAVGNATVVKLNYAPRKAEESSKPPAAPVTESAKPAPAPAAAAAIPAVATPPAAPASTVPAAATADAPPPPPPPPPPAESKPTPGGAVVTFVPSSLDVPLSGAVTATLMLANGQDVAAAPLQIQYDPKVLRLNDIVRGGLMGSDGQQVVFTKNIMNDAGAATVNLNRFPNTKGITGSGTLITLSFQAVGRGFTNVTIPNLTVRDSQGNTVLTATPTMAVNVK
jgi:general secretion pathway protein D